MLLQCVFPTLGWDAALSLLFHLETDDALPRNILLVTSRAVAKDEISKAELVRTLEALARLSGNYGSGDLRDEPAAIIEMNKTWHRRFFHLMIGDQQS